MKKRVVISKSALVGMLILGTTFQAHGRSLRQQIHSKQSSKHHP